jgi:hypothetical protein
LPNHFDLGQCPAIFSAEVPSHNESSIVISSRYSTQIRLTDVNSTNHTATCKTEYLELDDHGHYILNVDDVNKMKTFCNLIESQAGRNNCWPLLFVFSVILFAMLVVNYKRIFSRAKGRFRSLFEDFRTAGLQDQRSNVHLENGTLDRGKRLETVDIFRGYAILTHPSQLHLTDYDCYVRIVEL